MIGILTWERCFFLKFSHLVLSILLSPVFAGCQSPDEWEAAQNKRQPPDKVLNAIGVQAGMKVGEIGAGQGRYVVHVSKRVGPSGSVYASDIDKKKTDYLKKRCRRDSLKNVYPILGDPADPKFPVHELDVVYIIGTYHHIENRIDLLPTVKSSLKPDGILAIIENEPSKSGWTSHTTPEETVLKEVEQSGYELIRIVDILAVDLIYIFKVEAK
ncbi:MAG: class I SAM-dependent methyltransferase [Bacteroidales bacterium]|nr:MAG: class I SAM-dependent methyltransferase [Bacteroidales bacterium]